MWQVRDCVETDFGQILPLLHQLWPSKELNDAALRAVFERGLRSDCQRYICATEDGHVIGFCSLSLKNNLWQAGYLAHVDELIVDAPHTGRGIGRALLTSIIAIAAERGCSRVELDSAFHRKRAHKFYQAEGFENRAYLFSKAL